MNNRRQRLLLLERLAASQENTVSRAQLVGLSFTAKEIRGLVERRHLHPIHRGVYAVGTPRPTRRGWLFAAQLACGEKAFLTHRTGAGLHSLRAVNPWQIDVTVVGTGIRHRRGIVVHRVSAQPHPSEVRIAGGPAGGECPAPPHPARGERIPI